MRIPLASRDGRASGRDSWRGGATAVALAIVVLPSGCGTASPAGGTSGGGMSPETASSSRSVSGSTGSGANASDTSWSGSTAMSSGTGTTRASGSASTTLDAGTTRDAGATRDASAGGADAGSANDASTTTPDSGPAGPVVAFPGALGFGRTATGGRGGTVVHVTNLNDSGAGSLRSAVGAGNRIVVFDVGGTIQIASPISFSSNLTIAGQTAPGDGIAIVGNEASFSSHSNAIVRYIRVRPGCTTCTRSDPDFSRSGINLASSSTMIFDHVSVEFAQWNNIDSVGATNVTFQWSITADPVGQQFAAHTETGPYTWVGNLFANAHNRCPLAKDDTQYVDNVVYDYQAGYTAGNSSGTFSHDVIGNAFIAGPVTTNPGDAFYQVNNQNMYLSGNVLDGNANGKLDGSAITTASGSVALAAPWSKDTASIPTVSAASAYAAVVAGAGASLHRDELDALVVKDVQSLGTSGRLYTSPTQSGLGNGGYGTLAGGTAPVDTDGDGMPDAWETMYGLDPNSASDANGDFDHTGYTNIEKYINGIVDGSYPM